VLDLGQSVWDDLSNGEEPVGEFDGCTDDLHQPPLQLDMAARFHVIRVDVTMKQSARPRLIEGLGRLADLLAETSTRFSIGGCNGSSPRCDRSIAAVVGLR